MSQALTPGLQVRGDAVVRKVRELPVPGRILCERGLAATPRISATSSRSSTATTCET
jgi:hypothetical protein